MSALTKESVSGFMWIINQMSQCHNLRAWWTIVLQGGVIRLLLTTLNNEYSEALI